MSTNHKSHFIGDLTSLVVDKNTIATHALVTAPAAGNRIRVWNIYLRAAGTNTVKFQSGTNDLTGAIPVIAGSEIHPRPTNRVGRSNSGHAIFECNNAEAFNMVLTAAQQVAGWIDYTVETEDNLQGA